VDGEVIPEAIKEETDISNVQSQSNNSTFYLHTNTQRNFDIITDLMPASQQNNSFPSAVGDQPLQTPEQPVNRQSFIKADQYLTLS
jgi:hypothetical protein